MPTAPTSPTPLPRRAAMITRAIVALAFLALAACGDADVPPISDFTTKWHSAVNDNQTSDLYKMLDAASRQKIAHDLEVMRGLTAEQQQAVVNQLGGVRVESLQDITPAEYFGRLWDRITDGIAPGMEIESSTQTTANMLLNMPGHPRQRIRLFVEGGHWVWQLPDAQDTASNEN